MPQGSLTLYVFLKAVQRKPLHIMISFTAVSLAEVSPASLLSVFCIRERVSYLKMYSPT